MDFMNVMDVWLPKNSKHLQFPLLSQQSATKPDLQNLSLTRIPLKKAIAWLFALKLSWKLE